MTTIEDDARALVALIDRDAPVIRMVSAAHFSANITMELPSGRKITGRHLQEWIEYVERKRLLEHAARVKTRSAVVPASFSTAGYVTLVRDHRRASPVRLFWRAAAARNATSALVRESPLLTFMVALIVALVVVPWSLYGIDSDATGVGVFAAYLLTAITMLGVALRALR